MIKKVRTPGQTKVRTSAQSVKINRPSGASRKRPDAPKVEKSLEPKDEIINLDDIILE